MSRAADAEAAYASGVSCEALRDVATVFGLFSMIVRLADSRGWDVPSRDRLQQHAPAMLEGGYAISAVRARKLIRSRDPDSPERTIASHTSAAR